MGGKRNVLVVANQTAASDELLAALVERARLRPTAFTLLCPVAQIREEDLADARENLNTALERMRDQGLEIVGARIIDSDPCVAATEFYDARVHDEILVSTLPAATSRWLVLDVPHRIQSRTGALVTHLFGSAAMTFC
jgi:hypothetical protein